MTGLSTRARVAIVGALTFASWTAVLAPVALAWLLGWGR